MRKHCPGMIVQFSTGGRGRSPAERAAALDFRPDMASLSTGSVNFPSIVYENQPPLVNELAGKMQKFGVKPEIEIFDLSHIHGAKRLVDEGLMDRRAHLQYVLGVKTRCRRNVACSRSSSPRTARLPRRDLDRSRDRPPSAGGLRLGHRPRWPCPHGARGQHPDREGPLAASNANWSPSPPMRCRRAAGRSATPRRGRASFWILRRFERIVADHAPTRLRQTRPPSFATEPPTAWVDRTGKTASATNIRASEVGGSHGE